MDFFSLVLSPVFETINVVTEDSGHDKTIPEATGGDRMNVCTIV
jgi:hypothetical protein